jgi:hypothetical protein
MDKVLSLLALSITAEAEMEVCVALCMQYHDTDRHAGKTLNFGLFKETATL